MSHDNIVEIGCEGKFVSKYKESAWDESVGGVGGLNLTPHLVNPLMNPLLVSAPCVTSMVNLNANLGVQILTLNIQTLKPLEPKVVIHMSRC